jgi:hypothetical protein
LSNIFPQEDNGKSGGKKMKNSDLAKKITARITKFCAHHLFGNIGGK